MHGACLDLDLEGKTVRSIFLKQQKKMKYGLVSNNVKEYFLFCTCFEGSQW